MSENQGFYAKSITRQNELIIVHINNSQSPHSTKFSESICSYLGIKQKNQLRIGARFYVEFVFGNKLPKIVNLTIKNNVNILLGMSHGLVSRRRKIKNGQPAMQ